ncbi:MAG: MFS transporter, partial [Ktedonobacterales bacterium]
WRARARYQRNVYLLLLFTLGKGFQLSIASLSIALYLKSLRFSLTDIGLILAMPAIGALVAGVPMGFLADRIGRKPLLIISGFLNPLAVVAIGLSTSKTFLIVASLANGFLSSAYWVTNLPMLTESTTEDQRVGVLALNSFLLLGVGALGALIGGFVPELAAGYLHVAANTPGPLRLGVIAAALVVFIPTAPLIFLKEAPRRAGASSAATPQVAPAAAVLESPGTVVTPLGRRALSRLFVKLLIPDVLFTTGEGAVVALLPIFFETRFHMTPGALGALVTIAGLFGGATALTAPRFVRRFGKLRLATTMQSLSAPVMLLIGFSPLLPFAALAEFTRQVLRGLFEPTYAAFAMESVSARHRATLSGFYSLTWSMGYSIGPFVGGHLDGAIGLSASFVIGASLLTVSSTLLRLFFGRTRGMVPARKPAVESGP